MNLNLAGKIAVVTGAARGLGEEIALALAGEDARVVATDIDIKQVEVVANKIKNNGNEAQAIKADVGSESELDDLVQTVIDKFGRIDILVNNAGICPRTTLEDITSEEWDTVLAVNLRSTFLLSQKIFAHMRRQKSGKIINIASGAGKIGGVQVGAHYSASKAGIISLTKTFALHGAAFGVNVNAVCPGVIDTIMTTQIPHEWIEKYKNMIPLGRIGTTAEVANAVLFLASGAADYITGEITDVNGGFIMD